MIRAYERDYAGWADDTAKALRNGELGEIDREALAEEIEGLSRSAKRDLTSAFRVLLTHLLKAQYQPEKHTKSWDDTIHRERRNVTKFLNESPSLKAKLEEIVADAYEDAVYQAEAETGLSLGTFPKTCPWMPAEILE